LSGDNSVPPERLEEAERYVGAGQYDHAISAYDALLQEYGDHPDMYRERGRAKVASSDVEGGLADLKQAYSLSPETSAIAEEIGDVYYSRGSIPEAVEYYAKAFIVGYQGGADSRYRYAVALVTRGDGDAALEHLGAAIKSNPKHGEALFLHGQLLNERGRFEAAERALRDSEAYTDAGADYLVQLTIALIGQDELDKAEEVARKFIRTHPTNARAHALLGEIYLNRQQYEPARAQLIRALRTDPNLPRAQIALGRAWLAIGRSRGDARDLAKARQVLTEARDVHEGQRLMALGQVALAEGDLTTAERLLRESLGEGADALPVYLSLAESKARGEDLVGAAEELQRASGLAPDDAAITLSLAIAYTQFEEVDRAAAHFLKTIQGIGLVTPAGEEAGPILLPTPYIPVPQEFDVNQAIRTAYEGVLALREDDPAAIELQTLAESTTFMFGSS
jgi:tetratricopeptide (TPR) repeat protein